MSFEQDTERDLGYLNNLTAALAEKRKRDDTAQENRDKYLFDTEKVSKDIAARVTPMLPPGTRIKSHGMPAHLTADAALKENDPLHGVGKETMEVVSQLAGQKFSDDVKGEELTQKVFERVLEERKPASYVHKLKQDTSFFGDPAGTAPGYEEFKAEFDSRERDPEAMLKGLTPTGIAGNLAVAGGLNVAAEGLGRLMTPLAKKEIAGLGGKGIKALAGLAGRGLFSAPVPGAYGLATKLAGLALSTAAGFAVFDAANEVVEQSDWGTARQDEPLKVLGAELLAGGGALMAGTKAMQIPLKRIAENKLIVKAAEDVLAKEGTVSSIMEFDKSLAVLEKSKKVTIGQVDEFISKNKSVVDEALAYDAIKNKAGALNEVAGAKETFFARAELYGKQKAEELKVTEEFRKAGGLEPGYEGYVPDLPAGPSVFGKSGVLKETQGKGLKEADEAVKGYAPDLPPGINPQVGREIVQVGETLPSVKPLRWNGYNSAPKQLEWKPEVGFDEKTTLLGFGKQPLIGTHAERLALPGPVEKLYGEGLSLRDRVYVRSFYESNPGAKSAAIELGEYHSAPLTEAINRYAAAFPGKKAPLELFGAQKDNVELVARVQGALTKKQDSLKTFFGQAADYELVGKSAKQQFSMLDAAGKAEVLEEAPKVGVEVATATAAKKSAARVKRSTVKAEKERDAGLSQAVEKDIAEVRKDVIIRKRKIASKPDVVSPLPPEVEVEIAKQGVDVKKQRLDLFKNLAKKKEKVDTAKLVDTSVDTADEFSTVGLLDEVVKMEGVSPELKSSIRRGLWVVPVAAVGGAMAMPDDSQASVGMAAVDLVAKSSGKTGSELISELLKSVVGIKGNVAGRVEKFMDGIATNVTLTDVKSTVSSIPSIARNYIMTPAAVADQFYVAGKNPMGEMATRTTAMFNNIDMHTQTVKEIIDMVPGYRNASKEIRAMTAPLVQKFEVPLAQKGYHLGKLEILGRNLRLSKDAPTTAAIKADMEASKRALAEAEVGLGGYKAEWTKTMQEVSAKHSSARMSLALEDTAEFTHYSWLKGMLSADELSAVSMLKDLNTQTAARIKEAGGRLITTRPFAHHAIHPDSNRKAIQDSFEGVSNNTTNALNLSKLMSRSMDSKMVMPDIEYMFEKYIPDVERRIQTMQFWRKGQAGGWDAHVKELRRNGMLTPELDAFWKNVNKSLGTPAQTKSAEWARRYYSLEVAWRLFASPSVGFKHLMKQTGNMAIFPADAWAKGVTGAPKVMFELGYDKLRSTFPKVFTGRHELSEKAQLVRALTNQGKYNSAIAEMDMFDTPTKFVDKILDKVNTVGSAIVGTVEMFDRTATILMGTEMAAKKGMTPSQATHAMLDSVIRANFLSGVQNPSWVRDPHARAFFMFQGTPYKLAEQRFIMAAKAGKDIVRAGKVTWEELKQLKRDMKRGEYAFKFGLIKDALTQTKDVYGQSVTKQFMVNALTMGGLIWAGNKFFEADIQDQVFHLPFVKMGGEQPGVMLNPVVSAGWKAWNQRNEEDRDLLATEFMNNWLGNSGAMPTIVNKMLRLNENDIPEIYRDTKWKYFFGIPASKQ